MAELCAKPSAKEDGLLNTGQVQLQVVPSGQNGSASEHTAQARAQPGGGYSSLLFTAWLAFTSLVAIAALILGAYATSKTKTTSLPATVVLVSSPQEAAANGWTLLGNIYEGSGYWSNLSSQMLHPRSDHGAATYEHEIYIFGGLSFDPSDLVTGIVLNNMTRYNLYNHTAVEEQPMPSPRYRFGYAVVGDSLYVFGGFNRVEDTTFPANGTTDVFNFTTRQWSTNPNPPVLTFPRADLWGATAGGKVYAVGGYEDTLCFNVTTNQDIPCPYNPTSYAEELDLTTGKWSRIADMNYRRGDVSAQGVGNLLYAIGGVTGDGNCSDYNSCHPWTATMEAYDTVKKTWTPRASMNYARGDFATEQLSNGNFLAAGGEGNFTFGTEVQEHLVAQSWVEEYIASQDVWVPKAALMEPRFRFDMASDDGAFVYAFGGAPTCYINETSQSDLCYRQVLDTIVGYYDNPGYASLWAAQM